MIKSFTMLNLQRPETLIIPGFASIAGSGDEPKNNSGSNDAGNCVSGIASNWYNSSTCRQAPILFPRGERGRVFS
jgi:hypothetical protein